MLDKDRLLIEALGEHERAMAAMYGAFAAAYPEFEDTWADLSVQELRHASWVSRLGEILEYTASGLDPGRFRPEAIATSTRYVRELIDRAAAGGLPLTEAAAAALDLECALMEGRIFELFAGVPDCRYLVEGMKQDLLSHAAAVRDVLNRHNRAAA